MTPCQALRQLRCERCGYAGHMAKTCQIPWEKLGNLRRRGNRNNRNFNKPNGSKDELKTGEADTKESNGNGNKSTGQLTAKEIGEQLARQCAVEVQPEGCEACGEQGHTTIACDRLQPVAVTPPVEKIKSTGTPSKPSPTELAAMGQALRAQ